VSNQASQPVVGVELNFYQAGTSVRQVVSRDNTDASGSFGVFVPPGVYDVVLTPTPTSGLAALRLQNVDASADINLGGLTLGPASVPTISSITPISGPGNGGTSVLIQGNNFQFGASATLGGLSLSNVQVSGPNQISAVTPACPIGSSGSVVDLSVTNVGAPFAVLPQAFTFTPAASAINLTVNVTSPNVVLSWPATGQAQYTVFRSVSPALFGQSQLLAIVAASGAAIETFIDYGALENGVNSFYRVE
ncbi:MAG TPA: IPT/TIG domain-containing protein, partial [Candidatus Polarisedimenticolia bacterium]|nr:IPT/TIG domain-containing protein [Candidatus Polarisedimenticolia bacterium]